MTSVIIENLSRQVGAVVALHDISFDVKSGEFLTLLGPSGCGKSTTLAALAGLDRPTSGLIRIGERTVFDSAAGVFVDAQFRNLGLMFQSYALWPHMTVAKNLDFALELRKIRGKQAKSQIEEALSMVDMIDYIDRYPGELSGGQQQRVALARTLVYSPEILLLDEPLSNLDAKLREKARIWLGELQRRTGVTMIYVTHDQAEALSLSDRVIVMNRGMIAQIDTPASAYERPKDLFVADFVGASNLVSGNLRRIGSQAKVVLGSGASLRVADPGDQVDGKVVVSIRPESIDLTDTARTENVVPYKLVSRSYLGSRTLLLVDLGGEIVRIETDSAKPVGQNGLLHIPAEAIRVFAEEQSKLLAPETEVQASAA